MKPLSVTLAEYGIKDGASKEVLKLIDRLKKSDELLLSNEKNSNKFGKSLSSLGAQIGKMKDGIGKFGGGASGTFQSGMTQGASGMAARIPGVGGLLNAAQSAVESAAQEYVQGVTASKNIKLLEGNFSMAFGRGAEKAFKGMFRKRDMQAAFSDFADAGVDKKTLMKKENLGILEKTAKSQGVGSAQELMQRIASGQLKAGRGISNSDIDLIQSQSGLLGNKHTADIGMKMILETLNRSSKSMDKFSKEFDQSGASGAIRTEGRIQTAEENYTAGGAAMFPGRSYDAMMRSRRTDRSMRARLQPAARGISNFQNRVVGGVTSLVDDISEHGLVEGYRRNATRAQQEIQRRGAGDYYFGGEEENPPPRAAGGDVSMGRRYRVNEVGREEFQPSMNGYVASRSAMAGRQQPKVINQINITVPMSGLADAIAREAQKGLGRSAKTSMRIALGMDPKD